MGAYPAGQENYDLLREADDAARARIAALGPPPDDPVGGRGGELESAAAVRLAGLRAIGGSLRQPEAAQ